MNTLVVRGGRVVDPATGLDKLADVQIADGVVVALTSPGTEAAAGAAVLDAHGCIVAPGLVDLAARLREPGLEYRATLESELHAAVAGGVTRLSCPPDTDPVLDEPGLVEMLKHRARMLRLSHVHPLGALTVNLKGEALTEMVELAEAGCIGFAQAGRSITDTQVLLRALEYARTFDQTVWLNPVDPYLSRSGVAHSGAVAGRMGLSGVPVAAETIALQTIFELLRMTGARVHLCRISSAAGLELIRRAKAEGLRVTCDVAVHHLHLTDVDIGYFNPLMRVDPPFREQRDRDGIRAALVDGTIDAICSDHTPVDDDAKHMPFAEAEAGATGLELLLPLTLKWAQDVGLSMAQALKPVTSSPAALLGIRSGSLAVGEPADLCIFDPQTPWVVDASSLRSQGRNTPFWGYELLGQVQATIIDGRCVYQRRPSV